MPVALSGGAFDGEHPAREPVSEDMATVVVRAPAPTITSDCVILNVP